MRPWTSRALDPELDWEFFHSRVTIADSDRRRIRRLDEESCRAVWDEVVQQPVPATVVGDGWLRELATTGQPFEWGTAWNGRDDEWAQRELRPRLPAWDDATPVLFLWLPDDAAETTFEVFLRCWPAFLFHAEGPLLVSPQHREVGWFFPGGLGRTGRRPPARPR